MSENMTVTIHLHSVLIVLKYAATFGAGVFCGVAWMSNAIMRGFGGWR